MNERTYTLTFSEKEMKDLLFCVDHVLFMEADRFKQWCADGKDTEHHLYPKAVRALAKLENSL